MNDNYDIIIVGGGPAGSSAGYMAAKNGIKVAILEKEVQIADTVRTSGVTWIKDIKEFGIPENCYNPIKNFSFCSPNNTVTISSDIAKAAVLDVKKTYRWLAKQAQDAGADIFLQTKVTKAARDGDSIKIYASIKDNQEIFKAKLVIDASGFNSIVAKELGLVKQWTRFGVGAEYEATAQNISADTWWLMVGEQYSPAGYAWIFPVSDKLVRIGVGVGRPESPIDPIEQLKKILDKKMGPIKNLNDIKPIEFHYGLIPNDGLTRKTVYNNVILVGDSAGQANPLVLEGIRYAIKFGRVAGETAASAIKKNDTTQNALKPYEQNWEKAIKSKMASASKIQNRWMNLTDKQWDKELDIIKELNADEFLDFIKADFGVRNTIKLAVHHPKVIVRQLFSIIKP